MTKKLELPTTKVSAVSVSIIATMPQTKRAAGRPYTPFGAGPESSVLAERNYDQPKLSNRPNSLLNWMGPLLALVSNYQNSRYFTRNFT